ncbi:MAG TPA: CBS domain-containing protein [Candidatus Bathyarchaeota archaeon]|nr:CBS domain-containing protein [Candidatus Bathyarchaeota archaeon]
MPFLRRRRSFPLRVGDIMSTPPITARRDDSIEEMAKIMYDNLIGSVIIVDEEGKLEGIVTERDIIYAVAKDKVGKGLPVYMIMTENPITTTPDTPVMEAVITMRESNIRHLPVIDREGRPVGMLSLRDVLDAVTTLMEIMVTGRK